MPKTSSKSHIFIPESQELKYKNNFLIGRSFWPKKFIWQINFSFGNPAIEQLPNFWNHFATNSWNFRKENLIKKNNSQTKRSTRHEISSMTTLSNNWHTFSNKFRFKVQNWWNLFFRKKCLPKNCFSWTSRLLFWNPVEKFFYNCNLFCQFSKTLSVLTKKWSA